MNLTKCISYTLLLCMLINLPVFAKEANVLSPKEAISISGYPLSLEEAIRYTLQNNFTVEIARLERKIIGYNIQAAESIYDTTLTAKASYTVDQKENISSLSPKKSNTTVWNMGISKKLPSGTTLALDLENSRTSAPSASTSLAPYYSSDLVFDINQPLLKNGFGFLDRASVKLVKLDVSRADLTLLDSIEEDIANVKRKYWDLTFTYGNLQAKEDALTFANDFLRITSEQYEDGALEETDLYAAKANVEQRLKEVLEAKAAISDASDDLKFAMNFYPEYDLSPSDEPKIILTDYGNGDNITTALNHRRDLQTAHITVESQDLTIQIEKNALWPQLDLIGTLRSNGIDREMINAVGEAFSFDDPAYFIGAEFAFPLENKKARSSFHQADLNKAKALVNLKRIEQDIETDITKNLRAITLSQNQITHNKKIIDYQNKKLQGEEKKYGFGRSSSDIILRYEDDVINAKISYLQSIVSYAKSIVDLKRNQNVLLDEINWVTYENIDKKH